MSSLIPPVSAGKRHWYNTEKNTAALIQSIVKSRSAGTLSGDDIWSLIRLTWISMGAKDVSPTHWKRLKIPALENLFKKTATATLICVLHEKPTGPLILLGFGFLRLWGFSSGVKVIQPLSSLWECGKPASFAGFPSARGTVEKSGVGLFRGFLRASFPQRTCPSTARVTIAERAMFPYSGRYERSRLDEDLGLARLSGLSA